MPGMFCMSSVGFGFVEGFVEGFAAGFFADVPRGVAVGFTCPAFPDDGEPSACSIRRRIAVSAMTRA
jgi:hypothetical protein